jgi:hypothetical protein
MKSWITSIESLPETSLLNGAGFLPVVHHRMKLIFIEIYYLDKPVLIGPSKSMNLTGIYY